jgi:hypothetical protein
MVPEAETEMENARDVHQILSACCLLFAVVAHRNTANQAELWRNRDVLESKVGLNVCAELALAFVAQDNHFAMREVDELWYRRLFRLYESPARDASEHHAEHDYSFLLPVICTLKSGSVVVRKNQTCAMRVALEVQSIRFNQLFDIDSEGVTPAEAAPGVDPSNATTSTTVAGVLDPIVDGAKAVSPLQIPVLRKLLTTGDSEVSQQTRKFAQTVIRFLAASAEGKNPITERQCQALMSEEVVIAALQRLHCLHDPVSKVNPLALLMGDNPKHLPFVSAFAVLPLSACL